MPIRTTGPDVFDRIAANVTAATKVPKRKKGGARTPPRRQRGPSADARVWAAEEMLQPWELPKARPVPRKPPPGRTFAEDVARRKAYAAATRPLSPREQTQLRRQRVQWAEDSLLDPKARAKLAATMSPQRRRDLALRGVRQVPASEYKRTLQIQALDHAIATTKDPERRKEMEQAKKWLTHKDFNPLSAAGKFVLGSVDDFLGGVQKAGGVAAGLVLTPQERREAREYLEQVQRDVEGYSEAISRNLIPVTLRPKDKRMQAAGVGPWPLRGQRILEASIRSATQAAVGFGPGLVYMATNPQDALRGYEQQLRSYYGPLLHGDIRPLERQGVTPAALDALAVVGAGEGGLGRLGAVRATRAAMREGADVGMSAPRAYAQALLFRQTPGEVLGRGTMRRETPTRYVSREEPVEAGTTIQKGDRVIVRNREGEEVSVRATEGNGLVGAEAPDVNNVVPHRVNGKDVDLVTAYRDAAFEQRMVPHSPVGQAISDLYWGTKERLTRPGKGGRQLLTGKRRRTKKLRETQEVAEDRARGALQAFNAEHQRIQQDVVLSTAYDRMLRYRNPVEGVDAEIAARRQRGLDQTREQREVLAALEKAREHVANPSEDLQRAVLAGRALSMDTEQFLIARGFLTPERADVAKLAAERWVEPGHLRDEPLDSPQRRVVQQELLDHFGGDEATTRLAMGFTDTLARAWGRENDRPPADWYEENIRSVESVSPEQMTRVRTNQMLAQERETKRMPRTHEVFPIRDPETNTMRVARYIGEPDPGVAEIEWVREPNAGQRVRVPQSEVLGNTSQIRGWYSGVSNAIEKLPERVSKQEAISRITKAPGVKKDELKWLGVDDAIENLFAGGVKSVSRDELRQSLRHYALRFETEVLPRDEAFYETAYDVTLPGPRWDYHETLLYYPERHREMTEYDRQQQWEAEQEYQYEAYQEHLQEQVDAGELTEEEAAAMLDEASREGWDIEIDQEEPLYTAPHFESRPGYGGYDSEESYAGNLLAHLRQSGRWQDGAPIRVIEEAQSDWHQAGRRGYRTEEAVRARDQAEADATRTRQALNDKRRTYLAAFVKKLSRQDIHVRSLVSGEEGNVLRDSFGETPEFRIVIQEATPETPVGRSERRNIRDLEPSSDVDLRDLFDEMQEAQVVDEEAQHVARQAHRAAAGVPEAPWAGDKWEELLFREAVRQAVSNGEMRIAWTTGGQQAERYNMLLANNVQRIEYDGQSLRVRDTGGGEHSYDVADQDALVDMVGTSLASKLQKGIADQPEPRFDHFRVERPDYGRVHPSRERYMTETLNLPVSEMRDGDVVWLGYPSDDLRRQPRRFLVREDAARRYFVTSEWMDRQSYAWADRFPDAPDGWDGAQFAEIAKGIQRDQVRDYGEGPRHEPVVLEGENISIGGGGFIDAYDRRMRSYAKKYLGAEPKLTPLDDLTYDTIFASTPQHPEYPRELVERVAEGPTRPPSAPPTEAQAALSARLDEILPIYRVKSGDRVMAESESLQAALQAVYQGGADAGVWPNRVRRVGDQWVTVYRGGKPGESAPSWERAGTTFYDSGKEAVDAVERGYGAEWISDFDNGERRAPGAGQVWTVEIPEKFATELHQRGSPLFQRRRGSVVGLTRLTEEGADVWLDRDAADIATWVEEAAHAVIPDWFNAADAIGDPRADVLRKYVGLDPKAAITNEANEVVVRALQSWLHGGAVPSPQLRSLFNGLSDEMRQAYRQGVKSIARSPEEERLLGRMLDDPVVTSFFRDQFDVSPIKDFDPGAVAFQTMQPVAKITRQRAGLARQARSILPSRKKLASKANTMKAWEAGDYDVGPEVTAHYAAGELRTRMQDEQARRVLKYQEPIEIVNGRPVLKEGYQVYNYYGLRRANARLDEMFRRSKRYGDILDSEEEMLSADPATGSLIDLDPDDFTDMVGMEVGRILNEEMLSPSIAEAATKYDDLLRAIRDGKIGQIPDDVAASFLGGSSATYAVQAIEHGLRGVAMVIRIPTMLARWRMIGKVAYPLLNAVQSAILVGMNQGPMLGLSIKRTLDLTRPTRIRLMQEVGVGWAELTDVAEIVGRSRLERLEAREQRAFKNAMHVLSRPEANVRLTQIVNDLGRAGFRTEAQIVELLDRVKAGDPEATALLNQISRWSEDAVVRFRGLSPAEQFIVRDALFVYGWLRSAARFTLQFPLNRPVTAAVAYHIGQYGWEKMQNDFYALAWEQQGAISVGQRKQGNEFLRKLVDLSQFFPWKSGFDLMRPIFQMMGLEDTGTRPASFADLLSPSAEFAMRAVYGEDPRYGTGVWEGLSYDFDWKNFPGVYWAARLANPSDTGTKLRAPRDRWGVVMNLFLGQAAPYEVKQSVSYERWLDQQPDDLRVLIREQNNATQLAGLVDYAEKVNGGSITQDQVRAINADSADAIYYSLWQSKLRREKDDSGYRLTKVQRAAVRARTLQHYYPDVYERTINETRGLDLTNTEDIETFSDTWKDAWDEAVGDDLSDAKASVKDVLGQTPPSRSHIPFQQMRRDVLWLQSAPPESIARIKKRIREEGIALGDEAALAPVIEEEMLRVSKP